MPLEIRLLGPSDAGLLRDAAPGVFDHAADPCWTAEFLEDPRHHLAVGIEEGRVIGMASGVHYVHPDKPPQLWINEVGVAPSHQGCGVGRQILTVLLAHGRALGCAEAWVLTDQTNTAARHLYAAVGGVEDGPEIPVIVTFDLSHSGEASPATSHHC